MIMVLPTTLHSVVYHNVHIEMINPCVHSWATWQTLFECKFPYPKCIFL